MAFLNKGGHSKAYLFSAVAWKPQKCCDHDKHARNYYIQASCVNKMHAMINWAHEMSTVEQFSGCHPVVHTR